MALTSTPAAAPSPVPPALESVLRRDRLFVFAGLAGMSLAAWAHSLSASPALHGAGAHLPGTALWTPGGVGPVITMAVMWAVMMIAMMVPSASPVVLAYTALHRQQRADQRPFGAVTAFLFGYVLLWTAFSVVAAISQWGLQRAALVSADGASTSPLFGGGLLLVAGLFQWTSLKTACLRHCRSPFLFFMTSWRDGSAGALRMGLEHGLFCLGCCWALMALMFVAGVMNVYWLAGLSLFVLVEKLAPGGDRVGKLAGVGMIAWGISLIALSG